MDWGRMTLLDQGLDIPGGGGEEGERERPDPVYLAKKTGEFPSLWARRGAVEGGGEGSFEREYTLFPSLPSYLS
jgi:hypothetical protein